MPFRRRRQYACYAYERACEESVSACSRKNFCISVHRQTGQTAKRRARDGREKGEGNQRGWTELRRGHFLHKIIKGNVSIPLFSSCKWSLINPILPGLWKDVVPRGGAIMAPPLVFWLWGHQMPKNEPWHIFGPKNYLRSHFEHF